VRPLRVRATDFGDWSGLGFAAGTLLGVFADNTNSTLDNPNGAQHGFNLVGGIVHVTTPMAPPTISLRLPSPSASGWYLGAPSVAVVAAAGGSASLSSVRCNGIDASSGSVTVVGSGQVALRCTAVGSDGLSATTTASLSIDPGPSITLGIPAADGAAGWYVHAPTIAVSASDPVAAISSLSCDGSSVVGGQVVIATQGATAFSCTATDANGASASTTPTALQLDSQPPVLSVALSATIVPVGTSIVASPTATDATSGIASVSCAPVDTHVLGSGLARCSATDRAGNATTTTKAYAVVPRYHLVAAATKVAPGAKATIAVALADWQGASAAGVAAGAKLSGRLDAGASIPASWSKSTKRWSLVVKVPARTAAGPHLLHLLATAAGTTLASADVVITVG
jgi:hypothetical protein